MQNNEKVNVGCGCGSLIYLIISILLIWAILIGLPTSWGTLNIDIFPPKVKLIKYNNY